MLTCPTTFWSLFHALDYNGLQVFYIMYTLKIFQGATKLQGSLRGYGLSTDQGMDRVKIVCGNLEQNQFGLNHQAFVQLGESVSQIYHFGAHVNHVLGYNALR